MPLAYDDRRFSFTLQFNADNPVQRAAFFHAVIQGFRIHLLCRSSTPQGFLILCTQPVEKEYGKGISIFKRLALHYFHSIPLHLV